MRASAAVFVVLAQTVATLPSSPPPLPAGGAEEPARALPATVSVCRDRAARRCWSARREADCGGLERVFRTVIARDEGTALADCEASLAER